MQNCCSCSAVLRRASPNPKRNSPAQLVIPCRLSQAARAFHTPCCPMIANILVTASCPGSNNPRGPLRAHLQSCPQQDGRTFICGPVVPLRQSPYACATHALHSSHVSMPARHHSTECHLAASCHVSCSHGSHAPEHTATNLCHTTTCGTALLTAARPPAASCENGVTGSRAHLPHQLLARVPASDRRALPAAIGLLHWPTEVPTGIHAHRPLSHQAPTHLRRGLQNVRH